MPISYEVFGPILDHMERTVEQLERNPEKLLKRLLPDSPALQLLFERIRELLLAPDRDEVIETLEPLQRDFMLLLTLRDLSRSRTSDDQIEMPEYEFPSQGN